MNQKKNIIVNMYKKCSVYYARYEGNILSQKEVNKVLIKIITDKDVLKRIRTLQSEGNYHGITACAVDHLPSLEREAWKADEFKDPKACELFQLIGKLKLAKAQAKERMEAERRAKVMFRKQLEQQRRKNTRSTQKGIVLSVPILMRVSPKKVPKDIPGTITKQRAHKGARLAERSLFKDTAYT